MAAETSTVFPPPWELLDVEEDGRLLLIVVQCFPLHGLGGSAYHAVSPASFDDVLPMDLDFALAWSARENLREEAERQHRLLEEQQQLLDRDARRRACVDHGGLEDSKEDEAGLSRRPEG